VPEWRFGAAAVRRNTNAIAVISKTTNVTTPGQTSGTKVWAVAIGGGWLWVLQWRGYGGAISGGGSQISSALTATGSSGELAGTIISA